MLFAELSFWLSLTVATMFNKFANVASLFVEHSFNLLNLRDMGRTKGGYIGGRIGEKLRSRLDEIERKHGPKDTTMLEDALSALADYVEKTGAYRRPMMMIFDADADEFHRFRVAEGSGPAVVGAAATRRLRKEEQERAGKPPAAHK
jgi:hypothetical protein